MTKTEEGASGPLPRYRLVEPLYADDTLFPAESIVEFEGTPNESMEPLNEPAVAKMKAFVSSLHNGKTPELADAVYAAMLDRPREAPLMGTVPIQGLATPRSKDSSARLVENPTHSSQKATRVQGNRPDERPVHIGGE